MVAQSLRLNAAFAMLDRLAGKLSIEQITDELISIGYIENSDEDYRNYQLIQARQAVGAYRRNKSKTNDIQNELVNLTETLEDGTKAHYFRKCHEMTAQEAVQHIRYWDAKIAMDQSHKERYYKYHFKRHGKKFQRLLAFEEKSPVAV